ncbi:hypothetical protein IAT40_007589 [Kwoniella sp. CBS 6097]
MAEAQQEGQQTDASGASATGGDTSAVPSTNAAASSATGSTIGSANLHSKHDSETLLEQLYELAETTSRYAERARELRTRIISTEKSYKSQDDRPGLYEGQIAVAKVCDEAADFLEECRTSTAPPKSNATDGPDERTSDHNMAA